MNEKSAKGNFPTEDPRDQEEIKNSLLPDNAIARKLVYLGCLRPIAGKKEQKVRWKKHPEETQGSTGLKAKISEKNKKRRVLKR